MNKKEVQKRVLQNGKTLALSKFNWDSKTKTFSTEENDLVLDFQFIDGIVFNTGYGCTFKTSWRCTFDTGSGCTFNTGSDCTFNTSAYCTFKTGSDCTFDTGSDCTFKTGWNCTFKTGSDCTFDTGSDCTFDTGSDCTFKTGWNCTFKTGWDCTFNTGSGCTFDTGSDCTFKTGWNCTFDTDLYCTILFNTIVFYIDKAGTYKNVYNENKLLVQENDKWRMYNSDFKKEYIYQDSILSEIVHKRGNVYLVINFNETEETYLVTDGENWSHGETLAQAKEDLLYKVTDKDTSKYENYTLDTDVTLAQGIRMYRTITGACSSGVKSFLRKQEVKENYTIREIIQLTQNQYGSEQFTNFFSE